MLHLPGPAGRLEALLDEPAATPPGAGPPRAGVVLAHPHPLYGGTMYTKAVFQAAKAFCRLGCVVLRFNFRGVGLSEGAFADGAGEMDDFRAAIDFLSARHPGLEVWAAGMSFGSWIAMTRGASDDRVTRLVGIALPVRLYDFSDVARSGKPKYLVHGGHDDICPLRAVWEFYGHASEPKELVVIDGADHVFDGHASEVAEAIEDLLA